jgi:hypothetical protein
MIPDDVRIGTLERWDSLAHLRLVLAIEQKIGRHSTPMKRFGSRAWRMSPR